jgi:hypothetical protein
MLLGPDLAAFLLGDDILSAIDLSFADCLELADMLGGMASSEMQMHADTLRPQRSICRLTAFGGNDRYSEELVENIHGMRRVKPVRMPELPNVCDTDPIKQEELVPEIGENIPAEFQQARNELVGKSSAGRCAG